MSFQSALSAGNLTSLRSSRYAGEQFLCLWPNTVVFKTTLSATPSGDSYASVTFGSTISGNSANVQADMRVIIGPNDDLLDAQRRARNNYAAYDGRARGPVSGSTLPIGETSAALASGYYLWVIEDFPPLIKMARYDKDTETAYKDYDQTFAQIAPVIGNLPTAMVGICNTSGILSKSFAPTAVAGTDGASITGWTWTIPAGGTITSGSSSTQNITVEFSAGTYLVRLVVTDGTRTWTRFVYVWAVPSNLSSVVSLGFGGSTISADVGDGYSASIPAFDGIEDILDNTLCVLFNRDYYAGTESVIGGTNIKMVGRLRTESHTARTDEDYSVLFDTRFEIEGAAAQLGRIAGPILTLTDDTSPTVWDEIDEATWWRALAHVLQRHSTFLATHSLEFSETSDNYRLKYWGTNGNDLLTECNDLADSVGASLEFAPDGRVQANIRATQLSASGRNALPTIAALDRRDFIELTIQRDHLPTTGYVRGSGATLNTNTGETYGYESHAPGTARGAGLGDVLMKGQALIVDSGKTAAENELNARVGHFFAEQNPIDELVVTMPDGYGFLIPSRHQWYTWELDEEDTNIRGLNYTTAQRWLCLSVTIGHDHENGTQSVEATFRLETTGSEAETIPPAPQTDISTPIPAIPPILGIPDLGFNWNNILGNEPTYLPPFFNQPVYPYPTPTLLDGLPADGNTVMYWTSEQVWVSNDFLAVTPTSREVSPSLDSGWTIRHGNLGSGREAYLLISNGTNSQILYTEDAFTAPANWTEGTIVPGVFSLIKPTSTADAVYIYTTDDERTEEPLETDFSGAFTEEFLSDGSLTYERTGQNNVNFDWTYTNTPGHPSHRAIVDVGYEANGNTYSTVVLRVSPRNTGDINRTAPPTGQCNASSADDQGYPQVNIVRETGSPNELAPIAVSVTSSYIEFTYNIFTSGSAREPSAFEVDMWGCRSGVNDGATHNANFNMYVVSLDGTAIGGAEGTAATYYSTNNGVTVGSLRQIGPAIDGYGGFDVVKIGPGAVGGYSGQTGIAVAAGGTYQVYGTVVPTGAQPNAIWIPRYTFGSTSSSNANTTPEYLVASNALTVGTQALWKVVGSGGTFNNITPTDGTNYGVAVSAYCIEMPWRSGNVIAGVFQMGAAPRVGYSANAGTNWTFSGPLSSGGKMVTFRKGDTSLQQLFGADGRPFYSPNAGSTIVYKPYPGTQSTDPVIGIAAYG